MVGALFLRHASQYTTRYFWSWLTPCQPVITQLDLDFGILLEVGMLCA